MKRYPFARDQRFYAPLFSATADETELNTVVHETIDRETRRSTRAVNKDRFLE